MCLLTYNQLSPAPPERETSLLSTFFNRYRYGSTPPLFDLKHHPPVFECKLKDSAPEIICVYTRDRPIMRLINTKTLEVKEFATNKRPEYAILSHRWLDGEISFQQIKDLNAFSWMKGFQKVEGFCREALRNGYGWAWVDTCCIDKTSATELSEAINSMFAWYRDSSVCYVFLDDFSINLRPSASPSIVERELMQSVWFTRGWTLQELIAPNRVLFFDYKWRYFGSKKGLADVVSRITNINVTLLKNQRSLERFSCA